MAVLTARQKFIQVARERGTGIYGLPKTGQTVPYADYDDGYYQTGFPKTGARFLNLGDGTVIDLASGLMWVADPSQLGEVWGSPGNPILMTWEDAIFQSHFLNFLAYYDWRLPHIKELISLVNYNLYNPTIMATYFPNTKSDWYWSSTTNAETAEYKWGVDFFEGRSFCYGKGVLLYVRPVRAGL